MKSVLAPFNARKSTQSTNSSSKSLLDGQINVSPLGTKRKSFFRRQASLEDAGMFKLSAAESAFLPVELRRRLGRPGNGQLPPAPSVFKSRGAVMFVDVSGFTLLGEELRAVHGPVQGGALLADRITQVISQLATLCLEYGGDVSKFAGDALLCVWEGGFEESMLQDACDCALAMLRMMRDQTQMGGSRLQIHGGIARGSILHFHLGSADDQLRWYLMAGEALAGATALVDVAQPGEMLCLGVEALTATTRTFTQTLVTSPPPSPRGANTPLNAAVRASQNWPRSSGNFASPPGADKHLSLQTHLSQDWPRSSNLALNSPQSPVVDFESDSPEKLRQHRTGQRAATITRNSTKLHLKYSNINELVKTAPEGFVPRQMMPRDTLRSVRGLSSRSSTRWGGTPTPKSHSATPVSSPSSPPPIIIMTAESAASQLQGRGRTNTEDDPILRAGLPRSCNVYIPKALRRELDKITSEMRHDVGILFVDVEALALSEEEMASHTVNDSKLDDLNHSFVKMTRAVHCFGGEVRDMLFDDKGCVFIATFGAHPMPNEEHMKKRASVRGPDSIRSHPFRAVLAALAISTLVENARIGVSGGACFVGMCGVEKRHDFIVIGHEVNMAARLMVEADVNQIVVSAAVRAASEGHGLQFIERQVHLRKKDKVMTDTAFIPNPTYAKREEFVAEFRYSLVDQDLFVGREDELESIEAALTEMCLMDKAKSGAIIIYGPDGMGKSALAGRVRKMGKGRIAVSAGGKLGLNSSSTPFHAFGPALASLMGLRAGMRKQEVLSILDKYRNPKTGQAVDIEALAWVLPFLGSVLSLKTLQDDLGSDPYSSTARSKIIQVSKAITWVLAMGSLDGIKGTMLLLEHVEAMDPYSLLSLEQVLEHVDGVNRVAVCLTCSSTPLGDPKRAAIVELLMAKLRRNRHNLVIDLEGLRRDEAATMVQRMLGHAAEDGVVECLYSQTQGLPIHLSMALQWVKEKGLVARNSKSGTPFDWANKRPPVFPPGGLSGLIQARFAEQISEPAKQILLTATFSRIEEFDVVFLCAVSPAPKPRDAQVLKALFEGLEAGFLVHVENRSKPETEHLWHFKHRLVDKALREFATSDKSRPTEQGLLKESKSLVLRSTLGFVGAPEDFDKV